MLASQGIAADPAYPGVKCDDAKLFGPDGAWDTRHWRGDKETEDEMRCRAKDVQAWLEDRVLPGALATAEVAQCIETSEGGRCDTFRSPPSSSQTFHSATPWQQQSPFHQYAQPHQVQVQLQVQAQAQPLQPPVPVPLEQRVPDDIIGRIFSFCYFRDMLSTSLTSKGWFRHCSRCAQLPAICFYNNYYYYYYYCYYYYTTTTTTLLLLLLLFDFILFFL